MIPDLLVYLVFVPLEMARPDIGTQRNKEEPFVLNVGKATIELPSSLVHVLLQVHVKLVRSVGLVEYSSNLVTA